MDFSVNQSLAWERVCRKMMQSTQELELEFLLLHYCENQMRLEPLKVVECHKR